MRFKFFKINLFLPTNVAALPDSYILSYTSSLPKPLKTLLLSLAVSDLGVGWCIGPTFICNIEIRELYMPGGETF